MDTTEGEWGIFEDSWARYKRMTGLEDMDTIRDELRECCSKQLNTRLVQMHGPTVLGSSNENELLERVKAIAVKGVHKEVHRAAFQGMHQQQGEMYQAYAARLKAKADLGQYSIKAPKCGDDLCSCSGHGRQLYYRDEMVGTQLVAGAYNKEHQAKLLSESASMLTLQDKLDRLCTLEKSESSSATLSGQVQLSAGVKEVEVKKVEANKCSICHRTHKQCHKCQRVHPCTVECYNCHKKGHVRSCCSAPKKVEESKSVGEVKEMVAEAEAFSMELVALEFMAGQETARVNMSVGEVQEMTAEAEAFSMEMVALEFMAGQETARVNKEHKRTRQRASPLGTGNVSQLRTEATECLGQGEEDKCSICQVGRGMENFVAEGIDHMEWDSSQGGFAKASPKKPPLMRVGVKVLTQIQKQFLRRDTKLWQQLGRTQPAIEHGLSDSGAQVCTAGLETMEALGLSRSMLAKTRLRVRGVKRTELRVLGVVAVEISAGDRKAYQILYVTEETRQLILSITCLQQLGVVPEDFPNSKVKQEGEVVEVSVDKQDPDKSNLGGTKAPCGCYARSEVPPMPTSMPLPPTEEAVDVLEQWIKDYYASSAFNVCEHQKLQSMTGPPLKIRVKEGAEPVALHQPIPIPHHWRQEVLAGLERDCKLGVIRKVPAGTPTTWCSRMVVTAKHDGSPRRTVDLQALNKVSSRETHHTPSPFNLVSRVPKGMVKTVLDCWNGFHAVPLTPESSEATTFITEFGRYQYQRAPMGYAASGDAYTKRLDDITAEVHNKIKIIDDTLLYEESIEDCFYATCRYIELCGRNGVVFNPAKFKFGRTELDFAGFTVTDSGVKPTKRMLEAIRDFPKPTNLTGARAWFGLVNQVAYSFAQTDMPGYRLLQERVGVLLVATGMPV